MLHMHTQLRSWIPSVISLAVGVAGTFSPVAHGLVAAHPARAVLGLVAWAIVTHLLPSPVPKYRTPWD